MQVAKFSFRFIPADRVETTPEVKPIFTMDPGDIILGVKFRNNTAYDGTAVALTIGTGEDVDGFALNTVAAGLFWGRGAFFTTAAPLTNIAPRNGAPMCLVADTIDIVYTGAADATVGETIGTIYYIRSGSGG